LTKSHKKTGFNIESCFGVCIYLFGVVGCVSNRDVSHTMELNSTSQKWRAFPETSAERCTFLPVFQSNVPFLSVRSRILCS